MSNYSDIKRKHYRFPAYQDDEGVKIQRGAKRNLFAKDRSWLLTDEAALSHRESRDESPSSSFISRKSEPDRSLRRSRKETLEKQGLTISQKEELKKHRENLPDYSKKTAVETDAVGRTSLFGKEPRKSSLHNTATGRQEATAEDSVKRQYSGRSYFMPKYIPASVIPDKKAGEISQAEVMAAMAKAEDSYLTFDTEVAAYQEKKAQEPSVRKFPAEEHKAVNSTVDNQPKESGLSEKRHSVLDRGLQGLIEEASDTDKNGYFNRNRH